MMMTSVTTLHGQIVPPWRRTSMEWGTSPGDPSDYADQSIKPVIIVNYTTLLNTSLTTQLMKENSQHSPHNSRSSQFLLNSSSVNLELWVTLKLFSRILSSPHRPPRHEIRPASLESDSFLLATCGSSLATALCALNFISSWLPSFSPSHFRL